MVKNKGQNDKQWYTKHYTENYISKWFGDFFETSKNTQGAKSISEDFEN
jgi:hypothetical protein